MPIYALSASCDTDERERCRNAGMVRRVPAPQPAARERGEDSRYTWREKADGPLSCFTECRAFPIPMLNSLYLHSLLLHA